MPQTFYEVICIFLIYAFIGWCSEVAFAAVDRGIFVNRGFLNGPYCPIYGCGMLTVVVVLTPLKDNLLILFVGSFLLTSIIEFLTGFVLEKAFHNKWWDYADKPFNIMGYVCLEFSILWGLGCSFILLIIHPIIYGFIQIMPHIVGVVLCIIIMICFCIDIVVTVSNIVKFNERLRLMSEIADKLKVISNEIGENVYENVIGAIEKTEEMKETYAETIEEIQDKRESVVDAMTETKQRLSEVLLETREKLAESAEQMKLRTEQEELRRRYQELYLKKNAVSNRLMKAFPNMKSMKNNEILERLKKRNQKELKNKSDNKR